MSEAVTTTATPLPDAAACAQVAALLARAVAPQFDEQAAQELVDLMFSPSGFRPGTASA